MIKKREDTRDISIVDRGSYGGKKDLTHGKRQSDLPRNRGSV